MGPAFIAGLKLGDRIVGVNEKPIFQWRLVSKDLSQDEGSIRSSSSSSILTSVAGYIADAPDPIVLSVVRAKGPDDQPNNLLDISTMEESVYSKEQDISLDDSMRENESDLIVSNAPELAWQLIDRSSRKSSRPQCANKRLIHPLAKSLSQRGLLKTRSDEIKLSKQLERYIEIARLWQSNSYLRNDEEDSLMNLFNGEELEYSSNVRMVDRSPSTNKRSMYPGDRCHDIRINKLTAHSSFNQVDIFRQGLCTRIVNTFIDKGFVAYTIWIFDIESQKEWYTLRYYNDFKDLRLALSRLSKFAHDIPFPSSNWFYTAEANESQQSKDNRCKKLETFLREICCLVYNDNDELHIRTMNEIDIYVKSFLGYDTVIGSDNKFHLVLHREENSIGTHSQNLIPDGCNEVESQVFIRLKKAIQLFTFRVFLLGAIKSTVAHFISDINSNSIFASPQPNSHYRHRSGDAYGKDSVQNTLDKVQRFLTQIQNLILEGCRNDFDLIASHDNFKILNDAETLAKDLTWKENLYHSAVREQVELEVYVPIRSIASNHLVSCWRHDDMEIQFKMQGLRAQPQEFFKIKPQFYSSSEWHSVVSIISECVGNSTLPYTKLVGIVSAAKEIFRLQEYEMGMFQDEKKVDASLLGADDFLPIFIFCVVKAGIDRPNALAALLRSLCDPSKLTGEIGYYLSSFEAVILHISELDLRGDVEISSLSS